MPDDSADEVFERLQDIVQQAILREFPNPERNGCPGSEVLRELANRPRPTRDAAWEHVTHCSPCYREFLDLREQVRRRLDLEHRQLIRRRAVLGGIAVALVGGGIAAFEILERREPGAERLGDYRPALLDLRNASTTRGTGGQTGNLKSHVLPGKRLDLAILLPIGSEPGRYDIQWLKDIDKPLLSTSGNASVENGMTVLRLKLDLSHQTAGNYLIGLREPQLDWTFYPVRIR